MGSSRGGVLVFGLPGLVGLVPGVASGVAGARLGTGRGVMKAVVGLRMFLAWLRSPC
jgi:hypothetical protein